MRFSPAIVLPVLFFPLVAAGAAPAARWSVTLPDSGTYAYWVEARTGAVSLLPTTVEHKGAVVLPPSTAAADTLYVLDAHSGQIAARPLSAPAGPVALTVGDFHPVLAPVPPTTTAPLPARAPKPVEEGVSGIARFFTWVLGLAVAAAVFWFLTRLVQTRGEPLVALARRAGIDVPDPKPLDPNADAPLPVYEPARPRPVEKIPEEAGAAPPVRRPAAPRSAVGATGGVPQLVGTQGLAVGSTVALTEGVVSIGRDGDNGIVLAEHTVSRRHARLEKGADGQVTLVDEGSANGVYINGDRVEQAVLVAGDEIKIGDNYFRFEA